MAKPEHTCPDCGETYYLFHECKKITPKVKEKSKRKIKREKKEKQNKK